MPTKPVDCVGRWPDFLLIGAAKAGTTALFKAIGRHPRVFSTSEKQPSFFSYPNKPPDFRGPGSKSNARRVVYDEEKYRALFADCPPNHLAFEASTYLADTSAPAELVRHVPKIRLIAILRHPVDRAFSQFVHNKAMGIEPSLSFQEALDACDARHAAGWHPFFQYRSRGFYGAQLDNWMRTFPKEQILVLFYEDWLIRSAEVLDRIWSHLGLEPLRKPVVTEENVSSRQPRWPWLHHCMVDACNPMRLIAQRCLPLSVRDAITNSVASLNLVKGPRLDPALRKLLARTYHADLDRLEQITGRDLSGWRS